MDCIVRIDLATDCIVWIARRRCNRQKRDSMKRVLLATNRLKGLFVGLLGFFPRSFVDEDRRRVLVL